VSLEPETYSLLADKFIGLDRTYVSCTVDGFGEALKKGRAIDWDRVLTLCEWVVQQKAEVETKIDLFYGDPDWIASRIAIARLLHGSSRKRISELLLNIQTLAPPESRNTREGLLEVFL